MGTNKPISRKDDLVIQEHDEEILIYDLRDNRALCLNQTSALVWRACNGNSSIDEIAKTVGNEDIVWLALNDLKREKLIELEMERPAKFEGMSRREVIRNIGLSSMLALPMVAALVAPVAAQAVSTCGIACNNPSVCNPGATCKTCNGSPGSPGVCIR
jgi:hypothetical protein